MKAGQGAAKEVPPHIPGFPTLPLEAVGRLLILVADGRGVVRACEETGICRHVFYDALREDKSLALNYVRAREMEADLDADDVKAIADDEELSGEDKKIKIDARKWSAGVRRPKLYGPKLEVTEPQDPLTPAGIRGKGADLLRRIDLLKERLG